MFNLFSVVIEGRPEAVVAEDTICSVHAEKFHAIFRRVVSSKVQKDKTTISTCIHTYGCLQLAISLMSMCLD